MAATFDQLILGAVGLWSKRFCPEKFRDVQTEVGDLEDNEEHECYQGEV